MRKRLQKKNRLGPYREFCFPLALTPAPHDTIDWDRFFHEFLRMAESLGAHCGGQVGTAGQPQMVVAVGRRSTNPRHKRQTMIDWLNQREEIASVRAGDLVDAWHPPKGWWNNWIAGR